MSEASQGRLTLPKKVRIKEQAYLKKRRKAAKLQGVSEQATDSVGLAISGGGIRSATFALGVLQKLARKNSLRLIDYMTTVSGGGYIGSCISSLMSIPNPDVPPEEDEVSIDQKAFGNFNLSDNFPLLRADQMHHLRKHGSFLILREGLFRKDVLRAVGMFFVGIFSTFLILALPLLTIVGLAISYLSLVGETSLSTRELSEIKWSSWSTASKLDGNHVVVFCIGTLTGIGIALSIPFIHSYWKKTGGNLGETEEEIVERTCLTYYFCVIFVVCGGIFAASEVINNQPKSKDYFTFSTFMIPLFFSLGAFIGSMLYYSLIVCKRNSIWTPKNRSLVGASIAIIFNATIVFLLLAIVAFCIWAVLGEHLGTPGLGIYKTKSPPGMFFLILSGLSFLVTRLFALRGETPKSNSGPLAVIASKIPQLILQLAVPLFLFCTFMVVIEWTIKYGDVDRWEKGLLLAGGSFFALIIAGYLIDVNRLSIHYFYRDRLTETYLQTERHESGELKLIRDDSSMKITDLNREGKNKGNPLPYHIILCSLNLAGSRDLARRTRKSDHFIFSREYCGSSSTGYVPTDTYRNGRTKLATAMTISGAAVGSNMGFQTSFSRAFALTMFNIRLGYWLVNPRVYDQEMIDDEEVIQFPVEKKPKTKWLDENWKHKLLPFSSSWLEKHIWWPWFLRSELLGSTNSQGRVVNLSDGGHTGDNIGLYPLFQRRCRLIIASDAECDPEYNFSSLINAVNQIYIDENVEVEIDITQLRPDEKDHPAKTHFIIGKINYPKDPDRLELDEEDQDAEASTGWLIYLKSSLIHNYYTSIENRHHHDHGFKQHEPPAIQSYAARNKQFPHESTADQFFDDDQFEAYRALGFHVASSMYVSFDNWRKEVEQKDSKAAPTIDELIKWCEYEYHPTSKTNVNYC
ncbi:patatin-like phospholipase family protein [Gimesia aquarii]|uniref:Patatin-like phospholipase n=1 Tax=Gimesia aquarii TaxID=2527964 RepID=A0A517WWP1_9PLAN|nr:patatin-like phospholipase family protein [Gimesia aquarii]QDU09693.1 Patatin-like phospholipase [Gimesia aquarii]